MWLSTAEEPQERTIDWAAFRARTSSISVGSLLRYCASDVDPYTVNVAQAIGERFCLAPAGQRNLGNAFASMPEFEWEGDRMGVGYGEFHLARLLAGSESGFDFLGIFASLCEYYHQDVVVGVAMHMAKVLKIPPKLAPSDHQWARLIQLIQGVLAPFPIAGLITRSGTVPVLPGDHATIGTIVDGIFGMSDIRKGVQDSYSFSAGADSYFFAAVAEWLFDLSVVIEYQPGSPLYSTHPHDSPGRKAPQLVIRGQNPRINEQSKEHWPLSDAFPGIETVSGGRVAWSTVFQACFGRAFAEIDPHIIAEVIGGCASFAKAGFDYHKADASEYFLPQSSSVPGLSGVGIIETVTSWFPELRRLAPQMEKSSRASFEAARARLDEITVMMDKDCLCAECGYTNASSSEICKFSLMMTINSLGYFIARTVVAPHLLPKRSGVIAFYRTCHERRTVYKSKPAPSHEDFLKQFYLPRPGHLLEVALQLFTGTAPNQVGDSALCISHAGITASLTPWNPSMVGRAEVLQKAGVSVSSGSSHFHGHIFDCGYHDPGTEGLSLGETLELLRANPKSVRQIVRRSGRDLLFSVIRVGDDEEKRAVAMGWEVL